MLRTNYYMLLTISCFVVGIHAADRNPCPPISPLSMLNQERARAGLEAAAEQCTNTTVDQEDPLSIFDPKVITVSCDDEEQPYVAATAMCTVENTDMYTNLWTSLNTSKPLSALFDNKQLRYMFAYVEGFKHAAVIDPKNSWPSHERSDLSYTVAAFISSTSDPNPHAEDSETIHDGFILPNSIKRRLNSTPHKPDMTIEQRLDALTALGKHDEVAYAREITIYRLNRPRYQAWVARILATQNAQDYPAN